MVIDWSAEIRYAERGLGIRKYVPAVDNPTCLNAEYVTPNCDNVNLDEDGFCQICNRFHRMKIFGKEIRTNCEISNTSFGLGVEDEVFEAGYFGAYSKPEGMNIDSDLDLVESLGYEESTPFDTAVEIKDTRSLAQKLIDEAIQENRIVCDKALD